jgi:hypothetical protein
VQSKAQTPIVCRWRAALTAEILDQTIPDADDCAFTDGRRSRPASLSS